MKGLPPVNTLFTEVKRLLNTTEDDTFVAFGWFCFITSISILLSYLIILP